MGLRLLSRNGVALSAALLAVLTAGWIGKADESSPGLASSFAGAIGRAVNEMAPQLGPDLRATPDSVLCPAGWIPFDNPALHYDLCLPPGWLLTDGLPPSTGGPPRLDALRLISPEAAVGLTVSRRDLFGALALVGGAHIELDLSWPAPWLPGTCEPTTDFVFNGGTGVWCGDRLDVVSGEPDPDGAIFAIRAEMELKRTPSVRPNPPPGFFLSIIVRAGYDAYHADSSTIWELLQRIHPHV